MKNDLGNKLISYRTKELIICMLANLAWIG